MEILNQNEKSRTHFMQTMLWVLLASLLFSGILTFVSYPGIWYSDSYQRAETAARLLNHSAMGSCLSLLPEVVMSVCLQLTGNYAFYTWMQAFVFEAVGMICIYYFFPGKRAIPLCILFALCPIFWGYALYWETGPVTVVCLLLLVVLNEYSWQDFCGKQGVKQVVRLVLIGLCAFFAVGYRPNAATAIVGLVAWELFAIFDRTHKVRKYAKIAVAGALVAGTFLAFQVPKMVGLLPVSNSTVGPMWETFCMLNRIGEGNGYDTYLDDLMGEGKTKEIFEVENEPEESLYLFSDTVDYWGVAWDKAKEQEYIRRYITLIREQPKVFLQVKWEMVKRTMSELPFSEYDYDRAGRMDEYGVSDTPQRQKFYNVVVNFANQWRWARTPWKVFVVAFILLGIARVLRCQILLAAKLVYLAICYEGAFFITTQSHEFRYWFPTFVLLLFSMAILLEKILLKGWEIFRKSGFGVKTP